MWIRVASVLGCLGLLSVSLNGAEPARFYITNFTVNGTVKTLEWNLAPAVDKYEPLAAGRVTGPWGTDFSGVVDGNQWRGTNTVASRFYTLRVTPLTSNQVLTANILNRLAYGPTPDDLDTISGGDPANYIGSQLQPETLPGIVDGYTSIVTNNAPVAGPSWLNVSVTGRVSSATLYMYLREPGTVYIDDVQLMVIYTNVTFVTNVDLTITTNRTPYLGTNVLANGDFEQSLTPSWGVGAIFSQSTTTAEQAHSGASSLKMISTGVGDTRATSIYQDVLPTTALPVNYRCVLKFSYLPTTNTIKLTLRLSGNGTIINGVNDPGTPEWIYAQATGPADADPRLYIYLDAAGEAWVDNMRLVAGTNLAGANLLQNPDFETALTGPWMQTPNFIGSQIDSTVAFSGTNSLRIVASAAGSGNNNSIFQTVPTVNNSTYTVSYWYRPAVRGQRMIVRLSGSRLLSSPDTIPSGVARRLDAKLASLDDLRSWFIRRAVGSQQQLLQVLLQFLENHFVTQYSKSTDYFDGIYVEDAVRNRFAANWEYREITKWTEKLLQPTCTFYDLLKVSAESPAMIVYLDTVNSTGSSTNLANENYARELFELFCNGVDNGYDQNDIVVMSRAWTGWSVDIVDAVNINNPLAPRSTTYGFYPASGFQATSNLVGVWTFVFKQGNHGTNRAPIFSEWDPNSPGDNPRPIGPKRVAARFGSPWANTSYQLTIPARTGTAGMQDGYDVIQHLANLPYTMEYISVKLCRLFIHEEFEHGVYDYTDPGRSAEAELVRQCMQAWWNSSPRGNIRAVLQTIFNSELFRSHGGSMQKVRTPLEFTVSAIRALRSANNDGTFTADTDGYNLIFPLSRMGAMSLFNRGDPDGYPEAGAPWISAGTLAERIRFVQSLCIPQGQTGHTGDQAQLGNDAGSSTFANPVALLKKKLPSASWRNAGLLADYFLRTLYPAEGLGNLNQYRNAAVRFLNTDDSGNPSAFDQLNDTSTTYDLRVRGMVALLMAIQRFQEQ